MRGQSFPLRYKRGSRRRRVAGRFAPFPRGKSPRASRSASRILYKVIFESFSKAPANPVDALSACHQSYTRPIGLLRLTESSDTLVPMPIPNLPIGSFEEGSITPFQLAYIANIAKPYPNYRGRLQGHFNPFRRRQIAHNCEPATDAFKYAALSCRLSRTPIHAGLGAGDSYVAL